MTEIELGTLHCTETEDLTGEDDCLLEVRIDGGRREPYDLSHSFSAGEDWTIGRTFGFSSEVRFTLMEGDWPDRDDTLGDVTLTSPSSGTGTATFQEDEADYTLSYTVTGSAKDPVRVSIDDFKDSVNTNTRFYGRTRAGTKTSKVWPRLSPDRVVEWVEYISTQPIADRTAPPGRTGVAGIDDVYEVQQDGIGYCGMAAVAFALGFRQPRRYVETVRSLLERGRFLTGDDEETASGPLRRSPIPSSHPDDKSAITIEDADWMIMAALRDSKNFFDSVTHDDLEEGSYNHEQRYWTEEVLGYTNATIHETGSSGETAALQAAHDAHTSGGVGFLVIDHRMLGAGASGLTLTEKTIDHAVTYVGGTRFSTGDSTVSFRVQSWGDIYQVPPGGGTMPVSQFTKMMGGSIVGWPT